MSSGMNICGKVPMWWSTHVNCMILFLSPNIFNLKLMVMKPKHDHMMIPQLNDSSFYDNVKWVLQLFDPMCACYVWITKGMQSFLTKLANSRVQTWNNGVSQLFSTDSLIKFKASIVVDVAEASRIPRHEDCVHLEPNCWYIMFETFFNETVLS